MDRIVSRFPSRTPQLARCLCRTSRPRQTSTPALCPLSAPRLIHLTPYRAYSSTRPRTIGVTDQSQPTAKPASSQPHPASISAEEYHQRSDAFFEELLEKLELLQEEKGDMDVEYSAGVLNVALGNGHTYVLNKQPPNKQIWLSSPVSGPKRYDWVLPSDGQNAKEGTAAGEWIYLRDMSSLTALLEEELQVVLDPEALQI